MRATCLIVLLISSLWTFEIVAKNRPNIPLTVRIRCSGCIAWWAPVPQGPNHNVDTLLPGTLCRKEKHNGMTKPISLSTVSTNKRS